MARIQTETQQDLQAPGVSLTPVRVQPSPIAEVAQRIGPTLSAMAEAKADQKEKQRVMSSSSRILSGMNSRVDEVIEQIGPDLTPTQAIAGLQGELNDLIANSGLPPKQWSAIREQVESRISTLGKQYRVAVEGQEGIIDGVTDEWRPLVPKGADPVEELMIEHSSKIHPFTWAAIQDTAQKQGVEAANNLIISLGRVNINSKFRSAERQEVGYQRDTLGLQRDIRETRAPRSQAQFLTQFNQNTLSQIGEGFIEAIRSGADPEPMIASFKREVTNKLLENEDVLADAGTNSAEVNERLAPVLDSYTEYMTAVSSQDIDKRRLEELQTDIALKIAGANNDLPAGELVQYERAGKLESLARTAFVMQAFKGELSESLPNLMDQLTTGKIQEVVMVDQYLSPSWRQNAEITLNEENPSSYQRLMNDTLGQLNLAINGGDGRIRMNYDTMLWTIDKLKAHPLYETLQQEVPEVSAVLEEQEEALRNIGER